jgi:ABC-type multidrug transport system permease subunit
MALKRMSFFVAIMGICSTLLCGIIAGLSSIFGWARADYLVSIPMTLITVSGLSLLLLVESREEFS